ncbi:two-component sensor histidine kinase, partial [Streptomyces sp. SID8380]|nr:two-component sensor histidine kinase [Streptomyces sp. SID8380]
RERAAALGGHLTAAPRFGGGFRVHAILPLEPPDPTAPVAVPGQSAPGPAAGRDQERR